MKPSASSVAIVLLAAVVLAAGCAGEADRRVEVRVRRVALDPASHSPVVLLEDSTQAVALPIWIGAAEARAIDLHLAGKRPSRPLTHDLMKAMIERVGIRLRHVVIRELHEGTYLADVVLEQDGEEVAIDSRPSDAIALAVRFGQPIYVDRELFAREAVVRVRGRDGDDVVTVSGITVQGLSAELAGYFRLPAGQGVLVSAVDAGGPQGLRCGDVILEIDGRPVRDPRDVRRRLGGGWEQAALRVQRDGGLVDVALERRVEAGE
jgi:bifunctional DNase/RNase